MFRNTCADLPLMLLVYQVGFEYGHGKSQLLYEQKRT